MEDGVTENEKLQVFTSIAVREDGEEVVKEVINNGEEKPVGFINQIISSFAPEEDKQINKASEEKQEEEEKKGGGILSHIMSNLVSSPRAQDGKQAGDDLFDNAKMSENNGGGRIDNIISNLPTPLPDDAAPASDEASILIHSIIHD